MRIVRTGISVGDYSATRRSTGISGNRENISSWRILTSDAVRAGLPLGLALFAREIPPFARLNEAGPVEWMAAALPLQHGQLRLPERLAPSEALFQPRVVSGHHLARDVVA